MTSATPGGSRLRRIIITGLSAALVAGSALLSPAQAQAVGAPSLSIFGVPHVGNTLSAQWSNCASPGSVTWRHTGSPSTLIVADSYTLQYGDMGMTITASATCIDSATPVGATSSTVLGEFETVGSPWITGTATVGQLLTANTGTWTPTPTSYSYRWMRAGTEIDGAVSSTYRLQAEDANKAITVWVRATIPDYAPTAALSAAVDVSPGMLTPVSSPAISGTTRVGETLTVSAGSWSPDAQPTGYVWKRDSTTIPGATSATYTLTDADHGKTIRAEVQVGTAGYEPAIGYAPRTGTVLGRVDARGVTVTSLTAATPTLSAGCASIPVSMGYAINATSASKITTLTASAQVRNSKGASVGTVDLTSTDPALTGVATGTFQTCSRDASGTLAISELTGSYTGVFTATVVRDASKGSNAIPPASDFTEDMRGTFESALTASATVPALTPPVTPVKPASSKIIWVQAFQNHAQRTVIGKVVVYNAKVKRWVAVSGGPKLVLQKRVNGTWTKVLTTRASKAAWFKATWKASKKATYRLVGVDRKTAVSRTFSR
ncbi:MAG: hypothetical protein CVT62_05885 [Actinobacteria bacterium HGW-Actinobacteria-2]|nr:MAG: hypothetical protein CVT62_05885 [Actinobacteria bacterium HGW-Actinobacteria-2]